MAGYFNMIIGTPVAGSYRFQWWVLMNTTIYIQWRVLKNMIIWVSVAGYFEYDNIDSSGGFVCI